MLREGLDEGVRLDLSANVSSGFWVEEPVSDRHACVGEAMLAVDPLCGQGVTLAIASGIQAATVVHTILSSPAPTGSDAAAAMEFYRERLAEAAKRQLLISAGQYARQAAITPNVFWSARAEGAGVVDKDASSRAVIMDAIAVDLRVILAADVSFQRVPGIRDDIVTWMTAVAHPGLDRPIVYFNGIELASVLEAVRSLPEPRTIRAILHAWSSKVTGASAHRLLGWLLQRQLLVAA